MKLNKNNIQDMLDQEEQEFAVPNRIARSVARENLRQQENLNVLHQKRAESHDYSSSSKKKGPSFS